MADRLSITPDRRPEPVEAKTLRINPCSAQTTCEQNRHGFDFGIEFFQCDHPVNACDRINHAVLTLTAAAIDHVSTRFEFENARCW